MFEEDLKFGTKGEDIVYNYLRHNPKTKFIMDVSSDEKYQKADIDFIVQSIDNKAYNVEIKNDKQAHNTGNIVYEVKSNSNVGCLERSEADLIYYVTKTKLYCCSLKNLRLFIQREKPKLRVMGDNARGYLLNINELIKGNYITVIDDEKWRY